MSSWTLRIGRRRVGPAFGSLIEAVRWYAANLIDSPHDVAIYCGRSWQVTYHAN